MSGSPTVAVEIAALDALLGDRLEAAHHMGKPSASDLTVSLSHAFQCVFTGSVQPCHSASNICIEAMACFS